MAAARLVEIEWPDFGSPEPVSHWLAPRDYARRMELLREEMARRGWTHVIVYGDREHFGNLLWACGVDPRFEEALLVLPAGGDPLLLLGNECMNYAPASPAIASGLVKTRHWGLLSLPGQPGVEGPPLTGMLREAGIGAHSSVALAGWKPVPESLAVPAYLADAARFAAGWENVHDASGSLLALRQSAHPREIAYFEWTNALAGAGMRRVIEAIEPGTLDFDLLRHAQYPGVPLACHMTLKCGRNFHSLASARGERVEAGGRFSCGICYWGANVCRAGWVVRDASELPVEARTYLDGLVYPYLQAMHDWFAAFRTGNPAGLLHNAIAQSGLPVKLNAGHLIHFEEWLSCPVHAASEAILLPGMVMQSDVIPSHPTLYSTRMEDGYALLSPELAEQLPAPVVERGRARREFMRKALGLPVHDSVLPLSNLAGIVPPFLLSPRRVAALC